MLMAVWINFCENILVDLHGSLNFEASKIKDFVKRNRIIIQLNFIDFALGVSLSDFCMGLVELLSGANINFIEEDLVSEAYLLHSLPLYLRPFFARYRCRHIR